ncbi:MAG: ATP-binding protein [Synergistaceae bacterium]|jgi:anti-sigma regulatory factor (Ser/Thr protein kinase)|nr:ATP-binding protein [Synergistaceae bacterium]
MTNGIDKVLRSFTGEKNSISSIYGFISETVLSAGGNGGDVASMELIADEIFTNITSYAGPGGAEYPVTLEIGVENGVVSMTFIDCGIPFDPTSAPSPDIELSAGEREIGGLGIHMIRCITDEISYERDGDKNVLTVKKRLGE